MAKRTPLAYDIYLLRLCPVVIILLPELSNTVYHMIITVIDDEKTCNICMTCRPLPHPRVPHNETTVWTVRVCYFALHLKLCLPEN